MNVFGVSDVFETDEVFDQSPDAPVRVVDVAHGPKWVMPLVAALSATMTFMAMPPPEDNVTQVGEVTNGGVYFGVADISDLPEAFDGVGEDAQELSDWTHAVLDRGEKDIAEGNLVTLAEVRRRLDRKK